MAVDGCFLFCHLHVLGVEAIRYSSLLPGCRGWAGGRGQRPTATPPRSQSRSRLPPRSKFPPEGTLCKVQKEEAGSARRANQRVFDTGFAEPTLSLPTPLCHWAANSARYRPPRCRSNSNHSAAGRHWTNGMSSMRECVVYIPSLGRQLRIRPPPSTGSTSLRRRGLERDCTVSRPWAVVYGRVNCRNWAEMFVLCVNERGE